MLDDFTQWHLDITNVTNDKLIANTSCWTHLFVREVVDCDVNESLQLVCAARVLGALEDRFEDVRVLRVQVVVLKPIARWRVSHFNTVLITSRESGFTYCVSTLRI